MRSKPKTSRAAASTRRARPAARRSVPRADATAPGLDPGVDRHRGALQHIGGSQSDEWNDRLGAETVQAMPQLACETREQKMDAALHGLAGIAPQDELEGIMAAQMIAAHAAAMDCYRRAANEDWLEERREHLNQATRLSRASATLFTALQRCRRSSRSAARAPRGAAKGAKQPHARELPPARAARLDGLRHPAQPVVGPISGNVSKALIMQEERASAREGRAFHAGRVTARLQDLRLEDLPPLERAGAALMRALDDGILLSDEEIDAILRDVPRQDPPAATAAGAAATAAHAESAKQPSPPARAAESAKQPSAVAPQPATGKMTPADSIEPDKVSDEELEAEIAASNRRMAELEQQLAEAIRQRDEHDSAVESVAEAKRRMQEWRNDPMQSG
jgi:hypothetical protein